MTSWGLALSSHRSASRIFIMQPDCSSPPAVTRNDDRQPCGGKERVGLWSPSCPQLQGCSSFVLGGRASRVAVLPSTWADDPLLPPAFGGEGRSPALQRRQTATCCLVGVWLSVHRTGDGHAVRRSATSTALPAPPAAPGTVQDVVRRRAVSTSLDGLVLTPVARTGVRTSLCALGRPPFAGVALVRRWPLSSMLRWWPPQVRLPTAEGVASTDETVSATCGRTSSSLALMACSRPPRGGRGRGPFHSSVCPGAIAATV
jgi:hypothetical protein